MAESGGEYSGRGVNHEKQNFTGNLNLKFDFENKSLALALSATGDKDEVFHKEHSLLGFDATGKLVLYVVINNHPAIVPHIFNRIETGPDGKQKINFGFGNPEGKNSFREEININAFKGLVREFIKSKNIDWIKHDVKTR